MILPKERETLVAAVAERLVDSTLSGVLTNELPDEIDCADLFGESGLTEAEINAINDDGLQRANDRLRELMRGGLDVLGEHKEPGTSN